MFYSENLHYEVFNLFIKKTTNFDKKNPTLLTKLLLMSTAKQCGKKTIFLKKTVCSQTCYRLRAGILRQFSRGCFLHIQEYTSGRKCRPKKRTNIFVFETWYKNLRTFSETFPQGYLYCISCSKTPFGKKCGQSFTDHKHFWLCAEFFRQVVRSRFH